MLFLVASVQYQCRPYSRASRISRVVSRACHYRKYPRFLQAKACCRPLARVHHWTPMSHRAEAVRRRHSGWRVSPKAAFTIGHPQDLGFSSLRARRRKRWGYRWLNQNDKSTPCDAHCAGSPIRSTKIKFLKAMWVQIIVYWQLFGRFFVLKARRNWFLNLTCWLEDLVPKMTHWHRVSLLWKGWRI